MRACRRVPCWYKMEWKTKVKTLPIMDFQRSKPSFPRKLGNEDTAVSQTVIETILLVELLDASRFPKICPRVET